MIENFCPCGSLTASETLVAASRQYKVALTKALHEVGTVVNEYAIRGNHRIRVTVQPFTQGIDLSEDKALVNPV